MVGGDPRRCGVGLLLNWDDRGDGIDRVADDPTHATIEGVGVVLNELEYLSKAKRR